MGDESHVPQQSRRDKLREQHPPPPHHHRSSFYDHPFFSPTAAVAASPFQSHQFLPYFDTAQIQLPNNNNQPLSLSLSSPNLILPFAAYASVLKSSAFSNPAQQLLHQLCHLVSSSNTSDHDDDDDDDSFLDDSSFLHHSFPPPHFSHPHKSTLLSMLDEVYRKYKQYYEQIQQVRTSFEYISGLGNAAPYANQAVKAMYKHFKCLKNAILDQLQLNKKSDGGDQYCQRSVQNSGFPDHHQPVWRPQRGLPERAVTVLRAWLFEHFLHPYPSDTDKIMLAKQTGLSRSQVSNWFINARVRLWKPMVEEIYMLETKQTHKNLHSQHNRDQDPNPSSTSSPQQIQHTPPKRTRNEHRDTPMDNNHDQHQHQHQHPLNVNYNLASHPGLVVSNTNMAPNNHNNGGGGVSLTLGLHQNNAVGVGGGYSDPFPVAFPVAATRRFGLGIQPNNDSGSYVMGGHFGRDVLGGQLLHDFVG